MRGGADPCHQRLKGADTPGFQHHNKHAVIHTSPHSVCVGVRLRVCACQGKRGKAAGGAGDRRPYDIITVDTLHIPQVLQNLSDPNEFLSYCVCLHVFVRCLSQMPFSAVQFVFLFSFHQII